MDITKGFTVHLDNGAGRSVCGVKPRNFLGKPALAKNLRRVTCRQCEKLAAAGIYRIAIVER